MSGQGWTWEGACYSDKYYAVENDSRVCKTCMGYGYITEGKDDPNRGRVSVSHLCPDCNGTGKQKEKSK